MKQIISIVLLATITTSCITTKGKNGENGKPGQSATSNTKSPAKFNQELATQLGADKYGMKSYYIVMLTTGKTTIEDPAKKSELMKGHLANIGKLAEEGKIVVAGPFFEKNDKDFRGMFIFNTDSKETAESWVKTDPAVKAGIFNYELFKWYGSAALPLYLPKHSEISQENP